MLPLSVTGLVAAASPTVAAAHSSSRNGASAAAVTGPYTNVSVQYHADISESDHCVYNDPPGTGTDNCALVVSSEGGHGDFTSAFSGAVTASVPIPTTDSLTTPVGGAGTADETVTSLSGSGTFNQSWAATSYCTWFSGDASESYAGGTSPGNMQINAVSAVSDSSGNLSDIHLSWLPPSGTREHLDAVTRITQVSPDDPVLQPQCHAELGTYNEPYSQYNFEDSFADLSMSYGMASFVNQATGMIDTSGFTIDPNGNWSAETGGVLAQKEIDTSAPSWPAPDAGTITLRQTIQVVTSPCGATAAPAAQIGAAPTAAVAAAGGCLTITSPPADAKVALTNPRYVKPYASTQPLPSQRAPKKKDLIVKGTDACACSSIKVNGVTATQDTAHTWTAVLPNVSPGKLTITASGGGQQVQQSNTLVDLHIDDPAENASLKIDATPAMPRMDAQASLHGSSADGSTAVAWTVMAYSRYRLRSGWKYARDEIASGDGTLGAAWRAKFTRIEGGWVKVVATANIPDVLGSGSAPGSTITSDPAWLEIVGTNPGKAEIVNYAGSVAAADQNVLSHIFCHESTYTQFNPLRDPGAWANAHHPGKGEPRDKDVPADDTPAAWRPLFGGPPAGIGIAQDDPAAFPAQQWNWKENVNGGIKIYRADVAWSAKHEPADAQIRLANELNAAVLRARVNAGLRPIAGPLEIHLQEIPVPDLTPQQHLKEALQNYNAGFRKPLYKFDAYYVLGADGRSVHLVGSRRWIHSFRSDYPRRVATCAAAGPPLDITDTAPDTAGAQDAEVATYEPVNTPFVVTGGGFAPNAPVLIQLHSAVVQLAVVRSNRQGRIRASVRIPLRTPLGRHMITLTGRRPLHTVRIFIQVVRRR